MTDDAARQRARRTEWSRIYRKRHRKAYNAYHRAYYAKHKDERKARRFAEILQGKEQQP